MRLAPRFFRWHRWLATLVALQVLAWVLGGALFAWLPFKPWVKAEDAVQKVPQPLPADWPKALAAAMVHGPVLSVHSVATASGPAWKLRQAGGEQWLSASGGELPVPDANAVGRLARAMYRGSGAFAGVQKVDRPQRRLGIVQEVARSGLWVAQFDDALHTRLYFDGRSGEFVAARNEAWVLYDFFWRLHVMDYSEGEDFNNPLLRGASLLGLGLVATGAVLLVLALRRRWLRRRARSATAAGV